MSVFIVTIFVYMQIADQILFLIKKIICRDEYSEKKNNIGYSTYIFQERST